MTTPSSRLTYAMNGRIVFSVRLIDCRPAARNVLMMWPMAPPKFTRKPRGRGASATGGGGAASTVAAGA
jgi:hypothetical protein